MTDGTSQARPTGTGKFTQHLLQMPVHHKFLLTLATLLLGAGAVGHARNWISSAASQTPSAQSAPADSSTAGKSGFLPGSTSTDQPAAPATQPADAWSWSGLSTKLGGGFIFGFIFGWIFRAFLKTMALLTMAGALIIGGLSYFHVLNVDFSSAQTKYKDAMAWVTDQGTRLYGVAVEKMHATVPGAAGAFFGFRRKLIP